MARVRSPSYPNYSLEDAIENARKVFESDRRNPVDREVAAKHLGYSGLNGAADKSIGTMMQYGLFEKVAKGEIRVSQAAVDILHPGTIDEKRAALTECAFMPPLFSILRKRFSDGTPSTEALKSYLLRESFNDRAIGPITTAYTKTCALLERENAIDSGGNGGVFEEESVPAGQSSGERLDNVPVIASVGDLIQWESQGALQFETPRRVRWVSGDGGWLAVEGSDTGIPMSEVIVDQSSAKAPPPVPPATPKGSGEPAVSAGQRKAVFPVSEGDVTFLFPDGMTEDGIEELEAYLAVFLKKEKRKAAEN